MMEVKIAISTAEIYEDVYAVTAHTGKAMENIDRVSLSEDEMLIIEPFMKESASELSDVISSYGTLEFGTDSIDVSLSLPPNWKEEAKPTLTQCMKNYISNSICQRWFGITNKEDVKYYADKVAVNSNNIIKLLCERIRPKR